jgi:hypothetical protein
MSPGKQLAARVAYCPTRSRQQSISPAPELDSNQKEVGHTSSLAASTFCPGRGQPAGRPIA